MYRTCNTPKLAGACLAVGALGACVAGDTLAPGGFWLLLAEEVPGAECDTSIVENFTAAEPEEPAADDDSAGSSDEWDFDSSASSSGYAFYIELVPLDDGGWVLNHPAGVVLGAEAEDGTLHFEWTEESRSSESEVHQSGYRYEEDRHDLRALTVSLVPGHDGSAEVTWDDASTSTQEWRESDSWDPEYTGDSSGDIPAGTYLDAIEEAYVGNDPDEDDCDGSDCLLTITTTCAIAWKLAGTRASSDVAGEYLTDGYE